MTCQHRTCRLAAVAFFTLALGAVGHEQATWADTPKPSKPARPTIALHCGGAAEDLNVLRKTLEKAPGVKFQADDLKFADFGRDGGLFTSFFTIEMADRSQTDIGAIAKAVSAAPTSKRAIPRRPGQCQRRPAGKIMGRRCQPLGERRQLRPVQASRSHDGASRRWN
jgi:hypothetical protein